LFYGQHQHVGGSADDSKVFQGIGRGVELMSSEYLFRTKDGFMQGQELVVGVHISAIEPVGVLMLSHIGLLFTCVQHSPGLRGNKRQQPVQENPSLFGPFFDNFQTSDIVVKAGEAKIHAHKVVLSAHSSLFKAMFQVMFDV